MLSILTTLSSMGLKALVSAVMFLPEDRVRVTLNLVSAQSLQAVRARRPAGKKRSDHFGRAESQSPGGSRSSHTLEAEKNTVSTLVAMVVFPGVSSPAQF